MTWCIAAEAGSGCNNRSRADSPARPSGSKEISSSREIEANELRAVVVGLIELRSSGWGVIRGVGGAVTVVKESEEIGRGGLKAERSNEDFSVLACFTEYRVRSEGEINVMSELRGS